MKYIFLTVLVILGACAAKEQPEDLIEKEKMVKLLMEIHLLEAKMTQVPVEPSDSAVVVYNHFEKLLFEEFDITKDQYETSFNYYVDNTAEFEKIYNAVVDSLMQREKLIK